MFFSSAVVLLAVTALVYLNPRIRNVETELPDVVVKAAEPAPAADSRAGQASATA